MRKAAFDSTVVLRVCSSLPGVALYVPLKSKYVLV